MAKRRQKIRSCLLLVSFFLFPATYYYFSPVLIFQATLDGIINGSCILFGIQFATAFFLGRSFCGWICPAAGCQEAVFSSQNRPVRRGSWLKWVIWVPWLMAITVTAITAGGYSSVDFTYQTVWGVSISDIGSCLTYFGILFILIVIPAFIIGRRSFCHHLCWMAPFMILGSSMGRMIRMSQLRLALAEDSCDHCGNCTRKCPMSLQVDQMVAKGEISDHECILCGNCVDVCKNSTIHFSFSKNSS